MDLKYTYGQQKLHSDIAKHCDFNIGNGDMTGTKSCNGGFYGLSDMPAEFQKAIYYTLIGLKNTFCFLYDTLLNSKGSEEEHLIYLATVFKKLDADHLHINLP